MTMITAVLAAIIGPHLATIWPVSKPVVVIAPSSDYSVPQNGPYIGGVSSSKMSVIELPAKRRKNIIVN